MAKHRIYSTSVASVYPHYVAKAEKKGRTKVEVDEIFRWLTGYSQKQLEAALDKKTDFRTFFAEAPALNPSRTLITGTICGQRVEAIEEPLMREIRYLDKLVDELAKGSTFEDFFAQAPGMNPSRSLITGTVCGVRVQDVEDPLMREIRYLDKLIDELAKGKAIEKILRK